MYVFSRETYPHEHNIRLPVHGYEDPYGGRGNKNLVLIRLWAGLVPGNHANMGLLIFELRQPILKSGLGNTLHSRLQSVEANADCIWITVEDDGVGFDPIKIEQAGRQGFRTINDRAQVFMPAVYWNCQGTRIVIELILE